MTTLFGDQDIPATAPGAGLSREFGEAPFTTLDRRTGRWRDRSAQWRALGIQSEIGRPRSLIRTDTALLSMAARSGGTSIFDPVVCEMAYRWWTAPGDVVLDPFAGGSVRGIVSAILGRPYVGIELRADQVQANRQQADDICGELKPTWIEGDSDEIDRLAPDLTADFIFTCPPYHDLEVYSDDPADLSAMTWDNFVTTYERIIRRVAERLAPDRFAAFVVGDVRDRQGLYRGLPWVTVHAMQAAGLRLYQDAVLLDPHGTMQLAAGRTMRASRKLTRLHQYLLVAVKGSPKRAAKRLREAAA